MSSAIKSFLILLGALPLMIYIGSQIGSDDYVLPIVAGLLIIAGMVFGLFFRQQRVECLVLAFLLGGYIIGNRGFAQLAVTPPFYLGEIGLVIILVMMVVRYATSRELLFAPHLLARLLAAYLGFAFIRFCFDAQVYQMDAARDVAMVYYALFFFAAYQLGRQEETVRFLDRVLVWIFFIQSIVALISIFAPEWLDAIEFRGLSPLAQKADLTSTFSALGIIFISLRQDLVRSRAIRYGLVLLLMAGMILTGARAALVAMFAALFLTWVAARRWFILFPAVLVVAGILGVIAIGSTVPGGRLSLMRDQMLSIIDVSGSYHYQTDVGETKQADNTFRRVLWGSIYNQTVQDGKWVAGKGFGYDFITPFEREYNAGHWEGLRSAHNYYVTVFGRMGLVGFGLLVAITFEVLRHGLRAAWMLRRKVVEDLGPLTYWCFAWAILVSGTFGVVMEGPMGAIPFWSFLGLALASSDRIKLQSKLDADPVAEPVEGWHRPFPKPVRGQLTPIGNVGSRQRLT